MYWVGKWSYRLGVLQGGRVNVLGWQVELQVWRPTGRG